MFNTYIKVTDTIIQKIAKQQQSKTSFHTFVQRHGASWINRNNDFSEKNYLEITKQPPRHIRRIPFPGRYSNSVDMRSKKLADLKVLDEVCDYLEGRRERVNLSYSESSKLMKLCHTYKMTQAVKIALALYYNFMTYHMESSQNERITLEEHDDFVFYLFASFQNCDDLTELVTLRILWDSVISQNTNNKKLDYFYLSAFIHTFLNTGQNQKAIETFDRGYEDFLNFYYEQVSLHVEVNYNVFQLFPIIRILDVMCSNRDCNGLLKWLTILADTKYDKSLPARTLSDAHWLKYLNLALTENDYGLVKCIYDKFIMRDFQNGISSEDILFRERKSLFLSNTINSLNDTTFYRILHTFSISGDVNLAMSLIETHFLHKTLKGEKALTKDLCIKIIESYCYHRDSDDFESGSDTLPRKGTDDSICRVLDVVNTFVVRLESNSSNKITYKDLTEPLSYKFINYKLTGDKKNYSNKPNSEMLESKDTVDFPDADPFDNELGVNLDISSSGMGNVLANFNVLSIFLENHILYMKKKEFSYKTITLFVNCVLNHTNLYQNFTGTIKVLSVLCKLNPRAVEEWLDVQLYDIIMNSLSNSNSAKLSSQLLFNFLKEKKLLSRDHFRCLISANLRGNIHQGLQYFLYQYCLHFGAKLDNKTLSLLLDLPSSVINEDPSTSKLLEIVFACLDKNIDRRRIEEIWSNTECCKKEPKVEDNKSSFNRYYNHTIDLRDTKILAYLFNISMPNL